MKLRGSNQHLIVGYIETSNDILWICKIYNTLSTNNTCSVLTNKNEILHNISKDAVCIDKTYCSFLKIDKDNTKFQLY